MRTIHPRSFWLIVLLAGLLAAPSLIAADTLPREISDDAFWRMISDFSEKGGSFRFEYMSNEREFQFVIPELKQITKPGGAYLGVGPEQNFTYIAASRPKIAFIFDIRRDNMLEHLMYKAIFEMSTDRRDFISRLFSRKTPSGLTEKSTVKALFEAYSGLDGDQELFDQNLQAIKNHLMKNRRFQLTGNDQASIGYIYQTFFDAGPGFHYLGGNFEGGAYADLMSATDRQGQAQSYLASEESFQFVRQMEAKNLIIPLLGDFAGVRGNPNGREIPQRTWRRSDNVLYIQRRAIPFSAERGLARFLWERLSASPGFIEHLYSKFTFRLQERSPTAISASRRWKLSVVTLSHDGSRQGLRQRADCHLR